MFKIKTELVEKIKSQLSEQKIKDIMTIIKAQGEDRVFEVIASTDSIDRDGEIIDINGWKIDNFLANPVILWAHNSRELPIGLATSVIFEGNQMKIRGKFAPAEANPLAEQVFQLYKGGFVKTVSVGFIGLEWTTKNINNRDVWVWTRAELLELSFVPVPANPDALTLLSAKGFDKKLIENEGKTIEERVENLEKKVDKVEFKMNERINRKFNEISQRIKSSKAESEAEKKGDSEGDKDESRAKAFDSATLAYLSDKKEMLQDLAKFASEALRDIKIKSKN